MKQRYLGDGIYATLDTEAFHPLILTTGHHDPEQADNTIYFELSCVESLVRELTIEFVLGEDS